jgi:hypothetical protein
LHAVIHVPDIRHAVAIGVCGWMRSPPDSTS